jgi:hypothetical protein
VQQQHINAGGKSLCKHDLFFTISMRAQPRTRNSSFKKHTIQQQMAVILPKNLGDALHIMHEKHSFSSRHSIGHIHAGEHTSLCSSALLAHSLPSHTGNALCATSFLQKSRHTHDYQVTWTKWGGSPTSFHLVRACAQHPVAYQHRIFRQASVLTPALAPLSHLMYPH